MELVTCFSSYKVKLTVSSIYKQSLRGGDLSLLNSLQCNGV